MSIVSEVEVVVLGRLSECLQPGRDCIKLG